MCLLLRESRGLTIKPPQSWPAGDTREEPFGCVRAQGGVGPLRVRIEPADEIAERLKEMNARGASVCLGARARCWLAMGLICRRRA